MYQFPPINDETIFQSFICDLFNSIYGNDSFHQFGRKGHNQKGIDIFSSKHKIVIQCKKKDIINRNEKVIISELFEDIENEPLKSLEKELKIKFDTFIIASTYKDHPTLQEHCSIIKSKHNFEFDLQYQGWDTLQSKITQHSSIINKYFKDFVITNTSSTIENQIKHNLDIKRRFEKDFPEGIHLQRAIIKNSLGSDYPNASRSISKNISSWFRVNLWGHYHNGIEILVSSISQIIKDSNGNWDILKLNDKRREEKHLNIKNILCIGKIPYSNIVDYDLKGDLIYNEPHIYCNFINDNEPYECFEYLEENKYEGLSKTIFSPLDETKRKKLK